MKININKILFAKCYKMKTLKYSSILFIDDFQSLERLMLRINKKKLTFKYGTKLMNFIWIGCYLINSYQCLIRTSSWMAWMKINACFFLMRKKTALNFILLIFFIWFLTFLRTHPACLRQIFKRCLLAFDERLFILFLFTVLIQQLILSEQVNITLHNIY